VTEEREYTKYCQKKTERKRNPRILRFRRALNKRNVYVECNVV
jgi:hypothetical protein